MFWNHLSYKTAKSKIFHFISWNQELFLKKNPRWKGPSHLPHQATACWTWAHWAPCRRNSERSPFPPHGQRWRTAGASHRTAGRTAAWCHPPSAWRETTEKVTRNQRIPKVTTTKHIHIDSHLLHNHSSITVTSNSSSALAQGQFRS